MKQILSKSKKLLFSQQASVFSAASVIMLMIVASRLLGLVRQRTLANFFVPGELSLFFAAFRLPDLLFEVLVFGTFSSAFIPVFTRTLREEGRKKAWEIAAFVTNIGLLAFAILAAVIIVFANQLYGLLAPGFALADRGRVVELTRILFAAQGFFVASYVLTGVLESLRRFLVPALAPLFYNLGIILGTLFLAPSLGLMAPAVGVVIGAALHFLVQLPLAIKLGFRFKLGIHLTPEVKKIGKLALPRIIEVSFLQVTKTVELFLASLISTASYTFFTFGNTLQLLPVGLFGTSIAKAALPTLARQADSPADFKRTLYKALNQVIFFTVPIAAVLMVLRIPLVRLVFGTDIFSWGATVQTGKVVSAFAFGVVFQATAAILARAFYALHDTKTPVVVSVVAIVVNILADFVLIMLYHLPVWGLAIAFSVAAFIQSVVLFILIVRRIDGVSWFRQLVSMFKPVVASVVAGGVMFFLLKFFDRSVWVKELSFFGRIQGLETLPFEKFVLDTRYTVNLLALTVFVVCIGLLTYLVVSIILRSSEVWYLFGLIKRLFAAKKVGSVPEKESEPVSPPSTDTSA